VAKSAVKKPEPSLAASEKPRGWSRSLAEINAIVRKAEKGDKDALAEVRELLSEPGRADCLSGNIAQEALRKMVKVATGGNPVIRESTARKFAEMRAELLGPTPTVLECLLVERIIATWYHLHQLEYMHASQESMSLAVGLYYQKCISAAQKRYLAAVKGLSEVRKLALPALQVNIAKRQINVAGGTPG